MSSEVRFGNVSSIDYEAGKCEVTYPDRDDTVTEMVPFLSNGEYQTPEVDDLVLVLHPGESPEDAVVVGTVWNEKNKPPEGKEKVYRKDYANSRGKAYRKFDANAKELTDYVDGKKILKAKSLEIQVGGATVTISEGGEIKVTSPAGITLASIRRIENDGIDHQCDRWNSEHPGRRWRCCCVRQIAGIAYAHRKPWQENIRTPVRRFWNVCWNFRRCDFLRGTPACAHPVKLQGNDRRKLGGT